MKKIYSLIIALTGWLLCTGCSGEEEWLGSGNEAVVTFSVKVAEGIETKATLSDGTKAKNLVVGVFEKVNGQLQEIQALRYEANSAFNESLKADVTFHLVKGKKYGFIFWAQEGDVTNSFQEKPAQHYNLIDLQQIRISYSTVVSNDEDRDAFLGVEQPRQITGDFTQEVTLKRPFAQLNFLVTQAEFEAANKSTNVNLAKSQVSISNVATTLHPFTNTVGDFQEVTFKPGAIPMNNGITDSQSHPSMENESQIANYLYLATNYFLVAATGEGNNPAMQRATVPSVNLRLADAGGNLVEGEGLTVQNVPVQWNYRTNIYGNLLTANSEFKVEITPNFTGDYNEEQPQTQMVATVDEVASAIASGATKVSVQNAPTGTAGALIPRIYPKVNTKKIEIEFHEPLPDGYTINYSDITSASETSAPKEVHITAPGASTPGSLTVNLEGSTVTINGVYQTLTASTADNTLIIPKGTTVTNLDVKKGHVKIYGKVTGTVSLAEGCRILEWAVDKADGDDYLKKAINAKTSTVLLGAGEFTIPNIEGKNEEVTFEGKGIDRTYLKIIPETVYLRNMYAKVSFKHLTMQRDNVANGFRDIQEEHYDHCKVEGMLVINAPTASVKNTEFVQEDASFYNVYIKNSVPISFENCLFRCKGSSFKFDCGEAHHPNVTISNCQFIATSDNEPRPVFEMFTEGGMRGTLTITGSSHTGFVTKRYHKGWWKEWNRDTEKETNLYTGVLDGKRAVADGVWQPENQTMVYEIDNAQGLLWFKEQASIQDNLLLRNTTIKLTADIDMNDLLNGQPMGSANWQSFTAEDRLAGATIDGNGHTISNMVVRSLAVLETGSHAGFIGGTKGKGKLTIQNIRFDKADVNGGEKFKGGSIGVVIGAAGENVLLSGVKVISSNISGSSSVGGLIGSGTLTVKFENCSSIGNRIEGKTGAGGLAGIVSRQSNQFPIQVIDCESDNQFAPPATYEYEFLDTKIKTGSATGVGTSIKGLYAIIPGGETMYQGGFAEYYISRFSSQNVWLENKEMPLSNADVVINKDWQPVNTQ